MSVRTKNPAKRILDGLPPLYEHQNRAIRRTNEWFKKPTPNKKLGLSSPTGTGKSFLALTILGLHHATCWLITPSLEIIGDMADKIGVEIKSLLELEEFMMTYHIMTPVRFKNRILSGVIDVDEIDKVIIDECHHAEADGYQLVEALLHDATLFVGLTATYHRGTPKETAAFRSKWGEPYIVISQADAIAGGFLAMPDCEVWPLVDDDTCDIGPNGEFVIESVSGATKDKLADCFRRCHQRGLFDAKGYPTRPTVFGIHSSEIIPYFERVSQDYECSIRVGFITDETPTSVRRRMFADCLECRYALVHINTISEGVDISSKDARLRVYIDLAPTNSPLRFTQRFGRNRRSLLPHETQQPIYICTNRNLEKHGYILDGCLPSDVISKAQLAFDKPTERSKTRVFGLETLGKLKPTNVKLTSGIFVSIFNVSCMVQHTKQQYLVILHPNQLQPAWLMKTSEKVGDQMVWGKWTICRDLPTELKGFRSSPPGPLTEGQQRMWNNFASKYGVDVTQTVDGKKFQLVPALRDIGVPLE